MQGIILISFPHTLILYCMCALCSFSTVYLSTAVYHKNITHHINLLQYAWSVLYTCKCGICWVCWRKHLRQHQTIGNARLLLSHLFYYFIYLGFSYSASAEGLYDTRSYSQLKMLSLDSMFEKLQTHNRHAHIGTIQSCELMVHELVAGFQWLPQHMIHRAARFCRASKRWIFPELCGFHIV